MTKDKTIFIKNVYYMLSYAFQVLKPSDEEKVEVENFEHIQDLFAAILAKGVAQQLKQGLYREYVTRNDTLTVLRGKLNISGTIQSRIQNKQMLACEFDELSENNRMNQILKTTMNILVRDESVASEQKTALKKLLLFFDGIDCVEPSAIQWGQLVYQRNNRNYEMLMNICYFVLDGMLLTTESGRYKITHFKDEHMSRLYEKFILEYYKHHHGYLDTKKSEAVNWNLIGENDKAMIRFLPSMQTDIFLQREDRILIIDAKYYSRTMQQNYDKRTLHSNNLYQIFAYVKNQDKHNTGKVSGMLLYAKTDEEITPDCCFNMGGNQIGATTLDLSDSFEIITDKLDKLVKLYLI